VDGQYRDIPLNNPPLPHTALAVRVREPVVEARPLSVYSSIAGGDGK
jgi:hypothetical protein